MKKLWCLLDEKSLEKLVVTLSYTKPINNTLLSIIKSKFQDDNKCKIHSLVYGLSQYKHHNIYDYDTYLAAIFNNKLELDISDKFLVELEVPNDNKTMYISAENFYRIDEMSSQNIVSMNTKDIEQWIFEDKNSLKLLFTNEITKNMIKDIHAPISYKDKIIYGKLDQEKLNLIKRYL